MTPLVLAAGVAALTVLATGCVSLASGQGADPWYRAQLGLETSAVAGLACDGGSTSQYLAESNWQEINPVLGPRPSSGALWAYLGAVGAALIGVDRALDHLSPHWGPRIATALAAGVTITEIKANAVNMGAGSSLCGLGLGGPWKPLPGGEPGARTGGS